MERFERKLTFLDAIMVVLALLSVGLLVYDEFAEPGDPWRTRILWADLVIVIVFALEFLWRLFQAERKTNYALRHWYDLLGMVPAMVFANPAFRAFRLARVVRVVAVASRFLRVTDRTFGEAFVNRTLGKYKGIFVEELTTPVVLAVLNVAEQATLKGNYGTAVANGLRARKDEISDHVLTSIRKDTTLNLLLKTPGVGPAIERLPGRALEGVADTLGSKEMDDAIRAILKQIFADLKRDVAVRQWRQAPAPASAAPG